MAELFVPELKSLAVMLQASLESNFETVEVKVVQCPDLTKWGLAAPGICGNPRIVDVGGVPNLLDPKYHKETFDLNRIAEAVELPGAYVFGAGAASSKVVGVNAELMPTENTSNGHRCTKYAKTTAPDADGKVGFEVADYKSSEFGLLANLFACDGKPGDVIEVRVKVRKGTDNFVSCMRKGLAQALEEADNDAKQEGMPIRRCIGMGGVFKVAKGQVRAHVMPPFKKTLMEDGPEVEDWLKFFPMGPDLTCLSVFLTGDPTKGTSRPHGLDLRLEHTHFFSQGSKKEGGHYHFDTTPEDVEYVGYFLPAPSVYRIANAFKRERENPDTATRERRKSEYANID